MGLNHRLIYTYPIHMALRFNISLIVYGENVSYEYGGLQRQETYSAKEQIKNGVASDIPWDELIDENITFRDLGLCEYPEKDEIEKAKLEPIFLSYFVRWNSYNNYIFAKKRGFRDLKHEWERTHHIEDFDQVDSRAYLIHPWMKYPKFGHATATDYASRFIRYGLISREEGIELVKKHDHNLDRRAIDDFCIFLGYSVSEFWKIVENHYNKTIFKKDQNDEWTLINPIWEQPNN